GEGGRVTRAVRPEDDGARRRAGAADHGAADESRPTREEDAVAGRERAGADVAERLPGARGRGAGRSVVAGAGVHVVGGGARRRRHDGGGADRDGEGEGEGGANGAGRWMST